MSGKYSLAAAVRAERDRVAIATARIGLATLVAVVFPFSTTVPLSQKFATATVNLFIGIAIGSLLTAVGSRFIRSG